MKKFFILISIAFLLGSCKKDEQQAQTYPPGHGVPNITGPFDFTPAILKPYKFKKGSYWVYQNDSTGILDSIVAIHDTLLDNTYGISSSNYFSFTAYYSIDYYDYTFSKSYTDALATGYNILPTVSIFRATPREATQGPYNVALGTPTLMFPHDTSYAFCGSRYVSAIASLTLNSYTFNNINKIKITKASECMVYFANDTYLYYTDSIGIIKRENILSTTNIESWSIKRWHIIK